MDQTRDEAVGARVRGRRSRWRWPRRVAIALGVVVVLGVVARLALPSYLRGYVNRVLDQSPEYDGRIGEIELRLLRGEYVIHDIKIVKMSEAVQVPFFESRRV